MALNVGELSVQLGLDTDKYDRGLSDATRDANTAGNKMGRDLSEGTGQGIDGGAAGVKGKLGGMVATFGPMIAAAGLAAGIAFGAAMFSRGNELAAVEAKVKAVFGTSTGEVNKWADANNEAMGVSKAALSGMASATGDLLKPLGFTTGEAAKMSTEFAGMSGALSAWTGGTKSAAEVSEILNSAMLGEYDATKALGIALSGDEVSARTKQIMEATGATEGQAQAQAVQALVMEKSADAQKAWNDGSMDGIKNTNTLKAKFEDVKDAIASKLQPAFQSVTAWVVDSLLPAIERLGKWMGEHKPLMIAIAAVIGGVVVGAFVAMAAAAWSAAAGVIGATWPFIAIGAAIALLVAGLIWAYQNWGWFRDAVDAVVRLIQGPALDALKMIAGFIGDVFTAVITAAGWVWTNVLYPAMAWVVGFITGTVIPSFQLIGSIVATVATWVGDRIGEIVGFVTSIPGRIASTISGLWEGLKSGVTSAKNWVGDRIGDMVGLITGLPDRIGDMGSRLLSAGKDLIQGFINGIKEKIQGVKDTLGGLTDSLTSWKGPASLDKVILEENGELVIGGFIRGLESKYPSVQKSLGGLTSQIGSAANSQLGAMSSGSGIAAAAAGGSSVPSSIRHGDVNVHVQTNANPGQIAAAAAFERKTAGV